MPRVPRRMTVHAGSTVHKVWRGHNKEWNLGSAELKQKYLALMNEDLESEKYRAGSELQACTVMDNHSHELDRISDPKRFSEHMRRHHARYGRYFNKEFGRTGKVAEDRPHTTLIADDNHEMLAVFYIHANPHRANLPDAERYEYSTHKLYAYGRRSAWMRNIKFPAWYLALGKTFKERQRVYRSRFAKYRREQDKGKLASKLIHSHFYGPDLWRYEQKKRLCEWRKSWAPAPS